MQTKALIISDDRELSRYFTAQFRVNNIDTQFDFFRPDIRTTIFAVDPDLLFIDILPEGSAAQILNQLLHAASELRRMPLTFVRIEQRTRDRELKLIREGAAYVFDLDMREPDIVSTTLRQYRRYQEQRKLRHLNADLIGLLHNCKIFPHLHGYRSIFHGTLLLYHHPDWNTPVNTLYGHIATALKSEDSVIEKNIRDAIAAAWKFGGEETMPALLHCPRDRAPTNRTMLMLLSETLRKRSEPAYALLSPRQNGVPPHTYYSG